MEKSGLRLNAHKAGVVVAAVIAIIGLSWRPAAADDAFGTAVALLIINVAFFPLAALLIRHLMFKVAEMVAREKGWTATAAE